MKTKPKIKDLLKNYSYVNSDIKKANFPLPDKIQTEGARVIDMGKSSFFSQEALDRIKAEGCRPATIWELAQWKIDHEDEIKGNGLYYLAFGSTDLVADGYHGVPFVFAYSRGDFGFGLGDFEYGWRDSHRLLCFCDSSLETKTLSKPESSDTLNLESAMKTVREAGYLVIKIMK